MSEQIRIPYRMREAFRPFHNRTEQEAVVVAHRRMGKTVAICNDAQKRCLTNKRQNPPPRYAWFYPTRVRAKDIAWQYMKHYAAPIPGIKVMESELAIEYPNRGRVTLYGADNARGVGLYLDGCYYDEADEIPRATIADVAPALADYSGFCVYAGMLKGRYNLWKRYSEAVGKPGIFTMLARASETGIIAQVELDRLKVTMGEAAYRMQLECDPNASIANAIYGAEMDVMRRENRIKNVAIDPNSPLYAFFDLGHSIIGDSWTYWLIQLAGRDILLNRYFANTGQIPAYYAAKLRAVEEETKMKIGMVYLPHDGAQKDQMGKSAKDYLLEAGLTRIKTVPRTPNLWDSINNIRALMPRMHINAPLCSQPWTLGETEMPSGIDCLDFYTKKEEAQTGMILDVPVHNQYSHGADALRTFGEAYAQGMLDGRSDFASLEINGQLNVSRDRTTPHQARRAIHVTR